VDLLTHYLQIVLLGIVEGVTEFLPISSTGHLLIAEGLGLGHEPDVFNVVIQAGAILAVIFVYWAKIFSLVENLNHPAARDYVLKILLAFFITCVLGLFVTKVLHLKLPETLTPVAWATLIGGLVIFGIEFFAKNLYPHDDISWFEASCLGVAQIIAAVFPGASRSGSTIMTGLALGVKRPAATEFSFLLGIPTMFAASALDLVRYRHDLTKGGSQLIIDIALGFVVSAVVAFFVIKWLLRFVQSHTFNGFAVYRVLLGGALLAALATHALPNMGETETKPVSKAAQKEAVPILAPAAATTTNTDTTSTPTNTAPVSAPAGADAVTNMAPAATPPSADQPGVPATTQSMEPSPSVTTNAAPANVPAAQ
jgi:undecaprenyl-diphosphatase